LDIATLLSKRMVWAPQMGLFACKSFGNRRRTAHGHVPVSDDRALLKIAERLTRLANGPLPR